MLSFNKQSKYQHLYSILERICKSQTKEIIDYSVGSLCGWTSAKLHVDFTCEEMDNVCKLAFDLAKQRKQYLREKYDAQ